MNINFLPKRWTAVVLMSFVMFGSAQAAVDPNFYIFLCFGQSNMEGAARPEAEDLKRRALGRGSC